MKKPAVVFLLAIVFFIGAFLWVDNGIKPVNKKEESFKIFVIQKGEAVREIGNNLKEQGFIRDPVVFFLYLKFIKSDKAIQAGDYRLAPSQSLGSIIETLQHGTLDRWITIKEGVRAEEIAMLLSDTGFVKYEDTWKQELKKEEGYLFPDTYLIPKDADIEQIISIIKNNFDSKIVSAGLATREDIADILILASLIEREAATDEEKPTISGALKNRLDSGIALQVDATVQYAKGYSLSKKIWWAPITSQDYKSVVSPYNTYLNPGLPPAPISNPGIVSIKAAANPSNTPYYYYLHDSKGKIHFAKTMDEHNRNIQKYLQ